LVELIFVPRDDAALVAARCGLARFDFRAVLRAGCAAALAVLGLIDLDMI